VAQPVAPPPTIPGPTPTAPQPTTGNTILDLINSTPDLSSLAAAVALSPDVAEALATESPLTMFSPNNAAFAEMPADYVNALTTNEGMGLHLRSLLSNHATGEGAFTSSDFTNGQLLNMLSRLAPITVNIDDTGVSLITQATQFQFVGATDVIGVDATASNGVMHTVDQVLYPIWYFVDLITGLEAQGGTYSTLLELIDLAGLTDDIKNSEYTTLLAPDNAAFEALPDDVVAALTAEPNRDTLRQVLLYHFLPTTVVNPLVYPLDTDTPTLSGEGSDVIIRVQSGENSLAETLFNGVLSGPVIGLTQKSSWFALPEVLLPPGFVLPSPTAPVAPATAPIAAPTTTTPAPVAQPTFVTFPPIPESPSQVRLHLALAFSKDVVMSFSHTAFIFSPLFPSLRCQYQLLRLDRLQLLRPDHRRLLPLDRLQLLRLDRLQLLLLLRVEQFLVLSTQTPT
jgi:uncharacterized surface protein with fasciclin (FAS1) repeats